VLGEIFKEYARHSDLQDKVLPDWFKGEFSEELHDFFPYLPTNTYRDRMMQIVTTLRPLPELKGRAAKQVFDQLNHRLFGCLGHQMQIEILLKGLRAAQP